MNKKWTPEQDKIIVEMKDSSYKEIASVLNKSFAAISARRLRLGITNKIMPITIGEKFGKLTVVSISGVQYVDGKHFRRVECTCECGNICNKRSSHLRAGSTLSCGCYGRESQKIASQRPPGEVSLNAVQAHYKKSAEFRGISWNLTTEQFREIVKEKCFWCGLPPKKYNHYIHNQPNTKVKSDTIERAWVVMNGIDRVNSDLGYEKSNCVSCCSECNYSKSDRTAKQFFDHCKRVADHISKKIGSIS